MTSRSKTALLSLMGLAIVGVFLWMHSLASWRPQKVGGLPSPYRAKHISNDASLVLATKVVSIVHDFHNFTTFNLSTRKSYKWPLQAATASSTSKFGWSDPFYWYIHSAQLTEPLTLELYEPQTHLLKHSFRWQNREDADKFVVKINGGVAQVLNRYSFREFDLASDKMIHATELESPFGITPDALNVSGIIDRYAISSDKKTLYGSWDSVGLVWDARTGKLLHRWQMSSSNSPWFYSPDGRALICFQSSSSSTSKFIFVNSAIGKTLWTTTLWPTLANFSDLFFSQDDSEVVLPQKNNCQVLDVMTGRLLRQLPGPRLNDANIFQVTHDFIYTQNRQGEILRWRAR